MLSKFKIYLLVNIRTLILVLTMKKFTYFSSCKIEKMNNLISKKKKKKNSVNKITF